MRNHLNHPYLNPTNLTLKQDLVGMNGVVKKAMQVATEAIKALDQIYDKTDQVKIELELSQQTQKVLVSYPEATKKRLGEECNEMEEELEEIEKNETLKLVARLRGCNPTRLARVYNLKRELQGDIVRRKAKLVAKGYVQ